jgi:ribonuclease P/MRP protein subunit POP5
MKLKPLSPSLREKKRYIAFFVESKHEITLAQAKASVMESMHQLIGDLGVSKAGVLFLSDWKDNIGIMRVNTKSVDEAKASLALIKEVNEKKAIVKSVKVSGVLNSIRKSCF